MFIIIVCPNCGAQSKAQADLAGKKVRCPKCKESVQIPSNDSAPGEATPADMPWSIPPPVQDGRDDSPSAKEPDRADSAPDPGKGRYSFLVTAGVCYRLLAAFVFLLTIGLGLNLPGRDSSTQALGLAGVVAGLVLTLNLVVAEHLMDWLCDVEAHLRAIRDQGRKDGD